LGLHFLPTTVNVEVSSKLLAASLNIFYFKLIIWIYNMQIITESRIVRR
jgi:hypothetical protein